MRATELLLEDHREIERFLAALAGVVARLRAGEMVDALVVQQAVDVMHGFADLYHHAREEQHVFPVLERYALLNMAGRLECMLPEHQVGREITEALTDAARRYADGDTAAVGEIIENAGKYLQLLGHHMAVEEGILFELADRVVSDEDDAAMSEQLDKAASAHRASGEEARFRTILDSLKPFEQSTPAPAG